MSRNEKERSPQGDDGTYLFKDVIILLYWTASQRCITEVGVDCVEVRRQSVIAADTGALVPSHIDGEVHRCVACGMSRSREFKKKKQKSRKKQKSSRSQRAEVEEEAEVEQKSRIQEEVH